MRPHSLLARAMMHSSRASVPVMSGALLLGASPLLAGERGLAWRQRFTATGSPRSVPRYTVLVAPAAMTSELS